MATHCLITRRAVFKGAALSALVPTVAHAESGTMDAWLERYRAASLRFDAGGSEAEFEAALDAFEPNAPITTAQGARRAFAELRDYLTGNGRIPDALTEALDAYLASLAGA